VAGYQASFRVGVFLSRHTRYEILTLPKGIYAARISVRATDVGGRHLADTGDALASGVGRLVYLSPPPPPISNAADDKYT